MTKLMLVEDDKSLREIYGVRLNAEGYEIISAGDGEEALAMAVKEKPDLILADVMMPKISGFDMLDILRSTPETKDVKVVMMTALSSEDQRARGEALGANRYLVKSQVGIEDVVRTIHDVLSDTPIAATSVPNQAPAGPAASATPQTPKPAESAEPKPTVPAPAPAPATAPAVPPRPAAPAPVEKPDPAAPQPPKPVAPPVLAPQPVAPKPPVTPPAAPAPAAPVPRTTIPVTSPTPTPAAAPTAPASTPQPAAPKPAQTGLPQPTAPFSTPAPASLGEKVINPISADINEKKDIGAMIDQELGKTDITGTPPTPPVPPTA